MDYLIISCPNCDQQICVFVNDLNCRVFRCGIYKDTFEQIPPHLDKLTCDFLACKKMIYGCSKPFKINNINVAEICDYI